MMNQAGTILLIFSATLPVFTMACGTMTHIEVAYRAAAHLKHTYRGLDMRQLLMKHPDALKAGTIYPDSFYSGVCFKGNFSDTSETTHWMDFVEPAMEYFLDKYPIGKALDEGGEKLLTFLLGVMSHNVADALWHSLGIDQGFIDSMAQVNFWRNFSLSHDVADPGGDVVALYEMFYRMGDKTLNVSYGNFSSTGRLELFEWYVPIQDMLNIYERIGAHANESMLRRCAVVFMQIAADFERNFFHALYQRMVGSSPFLGSHYNDFFLGGLNDMASWTLRRWQSQLFFLENNGTKCRNTQVNGTNPIYWSCQNQPDIKAPWWKEAVDREEFDSEKRAAVQSLERLATESRLLAKVEPTEIEVEDDAELGGIYLRAKPQNSKFNGNPSELRGVVANCSTTVNYYLERSYANLGEVLVKADVNNDGFDDLIVGVPSYSLDNRFHEGRVYVVLGSSNGLPHSANLNLDEEADFILQAPFQGEGRFGAAITVADLNLDSRPDLIISAPIYAPNPTDKLYSGQVYIFYGKLNNFNGKLDVLIDCGVRFCNFGTMLTKGDVNRDGHDDLIIGSPYASRWSQNLLQNGMVTVFIANNRTLQGEIDAFLHASLTVYGQKSFSWLGYSAVAVPSPSVCNMILGAPASNVKINTTTTLQMAGTVYCFILPYRALAIFAQGNQEFANFGAKLAYGYPYGKSQSGYVAISAPSDSNQGKHKRVIPITLEQSGSVYFYLPVHGSLPKLKLAGDRHFGNFGNFIKFEDINGDGYDDFLVSSPNRQADLSKLGRPTGQLFAFNGGKDFLKANLNKRCGEITPCLEEQSDRFYSIGEEKARFGTTAEFFNISQKKLQHQVLVSAPRTDDYAVQSGRLILFNGC